MSNGGDAGAAARAVVEMHAVEAQANLSLSLSLSLVDVKRWNDLEVKKKIKRRGLCVLCGGEKQEKRKKKKRNETWMKMK